jgi:hypothetical protein
MNAMTRIIIELEGGLITEVYCSDPDADVSVIDRDVLKYGELEEEDEEEQLSLIMKAEQEIQEKGLTSV